MESYLLDAGVTAAQGFLAAGVAAGIKKQGKDLALIYSRAEATAAALFTSNRVKAAPVLVTQEHLREGLAQAVVINSGNANACTGPEGLASARRMAAVTAEVLGLKTERVAVASTGVIGVPLPLPAVEEGIWQAARALADDREAARDAATAILTTDTRPKEACLRVRLRGHWVTIAGMAKGAGMIHPQLATMLAVLVTDAAIEREALQAAFARAVARTFNQITVDGDTSTNDLALCLANGLAGNPPLAGGSALAAFAEALEQVCTILARELVADAEGATKTITVVVRGAASEEEARLAARAVARSNLVKTAVFGADANWGRILCALGYSGASFDPSRVAIYLEGGGEREQVAAHGCGLAFDEARARRILEHEEVVFVADLGAGRAEARAWGCDLSYDYVRINAAYRT
ncbi:MAG: bifunctional glutamate N-acetyltransferase/amino-acid acetyltransferase ArgJ [Clostridia bacterium]|nr:bifunctional glutamate N-acetyltransferase/amino-acid acetyltransferase ArgJ [Clostridia bacterium]